MIAKLHIQGVGAFLFLSAMTIGVAEAQNTQGIATPKSDHSVQLVSPVEGATIYMPHPHFRWQKKTGVGIEERYQIQISRDENFSSPASFASNKPWNTSSKQLQSSWP